MSRQMPDFVRKGLLGRFKRAAIVVHFGYQDEDVAIQRAGIAAVRRTAREFDAFGPEARLALVSLLEDPDPSVRVYAAACLVHLRPEQALGVLKDIYQTCPTEARMTAAGMLDKYKKGELNI